MYVQCHVHMYSPQIMNVVLSTLLLYGVTPSSLTQWNPEPSRVLGVFGLSLYTTERELRDLFSKYGDIEKVQVIHDHIVSC